MPPSLLDLHEPGREKLLERGFFDRRPEAERPRPPQPLAADTTRLGARELRDGLARRAGHAMHVGLEALHELMRTQLARDERMRLVGGLQPRARERLMPAVAKQRLILRLGVLGEPVLARLVRLDRAWR